MGIFGTSCSSYLAHALRVMIKWNDKNLIILLEPNVPTCTVTDVGQAL